MIAIVSAYLLLILFFVVDGFLRKGADAKSLEHSESDRGSTMALGRAYTVGGMLLLVAPFLDYLQIARAPGGISGFGLALMVGGLVLRVWSMRVLGEYYTRALRTAERQSLIDRGPYRFIRHPGYLGALMLWVGAGLATANWVATMLMALVMFIAYYYRIQSEEQMLAATFGEEYRRYAGRSMRSTRRAKTRTGARGSTSWRPADSAFPLSRIGTTPKEGNKTRAFALWARGGSPLSSELCRSRPLSSVSTNTLPARST